MKNLLFWCAFPFLIPQALYVRRTAPRFSPAAGPTNGAVGKGRPVRLLAIGDSIVAGVGAATLDKALVGRTASELASTCDIRVTWEAIGANGYDADRILTHLMPKLSGEAYDFIVVSVGVNDVTGLTPVRRWRRSINASLDVLQQHSPSAIIAVAGLPTAARVSAVAATAARRRRSARAGIRRYIAVDVAASPAGDACASRLRSRPVEILRRRLPSERGGLCRIWCRGRGPPLARQSEYARVIACQVGTR